MPYITTEIEVDVGLEDFDDDDIIEEYKSRGFNIDCELEFKEALTEIYQLRRLGKPYENELDKMICDALGVVI
jgi:hypothetical protein